MTRLVQKKTSLLLQKGVLMKPSLITQLITIFMTNLSHLSTAEKVQDKPLLNSNDSVTRIVNIFFC